MGRAGNIWARFAFYEIRSRSRLHVCVDLNLDISGRLMKISLLAGYIFFTGVTL